MTVSNQTPKSSYVANGSTSIFAFNFRIIDSSDLIVYEDGVQVTSGFTINGVNASGGGWIEYSVAPVNGTTILLARNMSPVRETDYQNSGNFRAQSVNSDHDRHWLLSQQLIENLSRSLQVPIVGGDIDAFSEKIKNLASATADNDAVNKAQLEAAVLGVVAGTYDLSGLPKKHTSTANMVADTTLTAGNAVLITDSELVYTIATASGSPNSPYKILLNNGLHANLNYKTDFYVDEINAFRVSKASGGGVVLSIPAGGFDGGQFPLWEFSEEYSRPKMVTRSVLFGDPGDAIDIGLMAADGDAGTPTSPVKGWRVASIYSWPLKSDSGSFGADSTIWTTTVPGPTAPFYARGAEISFYTSETQTSNASGGAMVLGTTRDGEVAIRHRVWMGPSGRFVVGGPASYEAGNSDGSNPVPVYPDPLSNNYTVDGIQRGRGNSLMGVQGRADFLQTPGFGWFSIVMCDAAFVPDSSISTDNLGPFLAYQKYNDDDVGVEFDFDDANDEVDVFLVNAPSRTRRKWQTWRISTGELELANFGSQPVVKLSPHASGTVNGLQIKGQPSGSDRIVQEAIGTDTNIDIQFTPKGSGVLRFGALTAITTETLSHFISAKAADGTAIKIAVVS